MNENDISRLCRLCLSNSHFYVNIYGDNAIDNNPIYEFINYVYDLKISVDDGIPEYVCRECITMAKTFHLHKTKVHKARAVLLIIKQSFNDEHDLVGNDVTDEVQNDSSELEVFIKQEQDDQYFDYPSDNKYKTSIEECNISHTQGEEHDRSSLHNPEVKLEEDRVKEDTASEKTTSKDHTELKQIPLGNKVPSESWECKSSCRKAGEIGERKVKDFKCEDFGKQFKQMLSIKMNKILHSAEETMACDQNRKKRVQNVISKQEKNGIHKMYRRYECRVCKRKFSEKGNLNKHWRIHSGVRPFKCRNCGKEFTMRNNLNDHERIHTGEKPFGCVTCGKNFRSMSNLGRHKKIHLRDNHMECYHCGKKFLYKKKLRRHMNGHL